MKKFGFKTIKKDKNTQARLGVISTPHGLIKTPAFVTVATNATVKGGLEPRDVGNIGGQVLLSNTYHLYVRDQVDAVKKAGGLSSFMNWNGPTYTDSGGFQVFSLGQRLEDGVGKFANYDHIQKITPPRKKLMQVDDDGVNFKSHIDGSSRRLTPESSMKIQMDLGADMIFAFDEPTSPATDIEYSRIALERTHAWAKRCKKSHTKKDQALFGIVQGGPHEALRRESAQFMADLDFPGFGIGGSYHRPNKQARFPELDWVVPYLPNNKPRHFLGIGGIEDMIVAVFQGMDTFDCVIPTREARHGRLYMWNPRANLDTYFEYFRHIVEAGRGRSLQKKSNFYSVINVTNRAFRLDHKHTVSIGDKQGYSLSYVHHLFKTNELLAFRIATLHNLKFYFDLMAALRAFLKGL